MDPLSIAVGVLAIAESGLLLSKTIHNLVKTFKDAPKQMSEIAARISELSRRFKCLNVILRGNQRFLERSLLKSLRSSTHRIKKISRELKVLVDDGQKCKHKRIAWVGAKKQSQELLDRIRKEETTVYRYIDNIMLSVMLTTVTRVDRMDSSLTESLEKLVATRMMEDTSPMQDENRQTQDTGTTDQVNEVVHEAPQHSSSRRDDTEAQAKVDALKDCDKQSSDQFCEERPQTLPTNTTLAVDLLNKLLKHADIQNGRVQILYGPVCITQTSSRFQKSGGQRGQRCRRSRQKRNGHDAPSEECKEPPSTPQEDKSQAEHEFTATEPFGDSPVHLIDPNGVEHVFPFEKVKTWNGMEESLLSTSFGGRISKTDIVEGRYSLNMKDQQDVQPARWRSSIRPGSVFHMVMWGYEPGSPRY